jgi:methyltransferase (TIGR00027 family)
MSGGALPAVSTTAVGVALIRAAESGRADGWFSDPLAAAFVAASGWTPPEASPELQARAAALVEWIRVRTRFLDDLVRDACAGGCAQVVLLAAGLDARAFRLGLAPDVRLFELDLPGILAFKQEVVASEGLVPTCGRVVVPTDLTGPWSTALVDAGFDPTARTVWLAEGLLVYLTPEENERLVDAVSELAAPGSRLGLTLSGRTEGAEPTNEAPVFEHERLWRSASPGDAATWLGPRGWTVDVHLAAERAETYGDPMGPASTARARSRLVDATRLA